MRWADPAVFTLLLFLPLIVLFGKRAKGKIRFSSIETLKRIQKPAPFHPRAILSALRILALVCVVAALARPQAGKHFSEVASQGVDIFLVLDTSGSMQALDFELDGKRATRLQVVQRVATEFIEKRPSDRLGLIVFGEEAYTQCPLTLDHGILLDFLKRVEIGMAGDATALGSAIGVAVSRMKDLEAKSKVVVLLTDGRSNAGRLPPNKAAQIAQALGIKVYTIGVGTQGKAPFLVDTIFGKQFVYQSVDLDENTLMDIAQTTNAKYYRATDTDELRKIYKEIDRLETTEIKVKEYTEYNELFHYILLAGIFFLLAEIGLSQTKLRMIP